MSQPTGEKRSVRQVPNPPRQQSTNRPRSVQPKRDTFPYIMGGVIGAIIVVLMAAIYLLVANNSGGTGTSAASAGSTTLGVTTLATAPPQADAPPRVSQADFKTEYDSANPPLIIDVRSKEAYDAGHIKGAISFPEADVDTRVSELPKDKPIVAYCQ